MIAKASDFIHFTAYQTLSNIFAMKKVHQWLCLLSADLLPCLKKIFLKGKVRTPFTNSPTEIFPFSGDSHHLLPRGSSGSWLLLDSTGICFANSSSSETFLLYFGKCIFSLALIHKPYPMLSSVKVVSCQRVVDLVRISCMVWTKGSY